MRANAGDQLRLSHLKSLLAVISTLSSGRPDDSSVGLPTELVVFISK
ncbi:MAG: hypothetical protein ACTHMT_05315 [Verrucomicrobiota bacterium]